MGVRFAALTALVLVALLLKTIVTPAVAIAGYRPDVLTLVVVAVALMEGADSGLRFGFAAGLAQDLISGGNALVGLWAIVLMAVGYGAGLAKPYLASSQQSAAILVAGAMAAAATLGYGILGKLFAVIGASWPQVASATLLVGLYSAAVAPLVMRPAQGLMKQFPPRSTG